MNISFTPIWRTALIFVVILVLIIDIGMLSAVGIDGWRMFLKFTCYLIVIAVFFTSFGLYKDYVSYKKMGKNTRILLLYVIMNIFLVYVLAISIRGLSVGESEYIGSCSIMGSFSDRSKYSLKIQNNTMFVGRSEFQNLVSPGTMAVNGLYPCRSSVRIVYIKDYYLPGESLYLSSTVLD